MMFIRKGKCTVNTRAIHERVSATRDPMIRESKMVHAYWILLQWFKWVLDKYWPTEQ